VGTFSRLRIAILLVVLVIVTGVLGYRFLADYPWFDALYMTIITLTTVGYLEVHPLSPTGRGFTMALLVAGVGIVLYTVVTLAESVVQGEFQRFFGRRRMEQRIAALTAHYLVCGFGRIGEVVCRELRAKPVPFVVIEHDAERVCLAEAAQYLVLQGDATNEATLLTAGVQQAQGLFATLPSDAANVFVTLTAKQLNPRLRTIVRAETEHSARTLRHAGADQVVSPYALGGHRMAQAALRPAVVDFVQLVTSAGELELGIEQVRVTDASPLCGQSLASGNVRQQFGVVVVGIQRTSGRMEFNPAPEAVIQPGDFLIVMGKPDSLKQLELIAGERSASRASLSPT
jgi:voltage-gated potassium channel